MPRTNSNRKAQHKTHTSKRKHKRRTDRQGTYLPTIQEPRDRTKDPIHCFLNVDNTSDVVCRATKVQKLLEQDVTCLRAYEAPHLACPLKFDRIRSATELKEDEIDACVAIVQQTSGDDYRTSSIGWNRKSKKEEMMDKEMIYLLVRQGNSEAASEQETKDMDIEAGDKGEQAALQPNKPESLHTSNDGVILGFISFMFTYDDPPYQDHEVVYIYEVHLHECLRGRGLGSSLIKFVERTAAHISIPKVMLTVFTANKGAIALYSKLGYGKDACSPEDRITRNKTVEADYMIMSKEGLC